MRVVFVTLGLIVIDVCLTHPCAITGSESSRLKPPIDLHRLRRRGFSLRASSAKVLSPALLRKPVPKAAVTSANAPHAKLGRSVGSSGIVPPNA
jgi:hypothetical protein